MKERLSMHAKDLDTYVAKEILSNEFRKYVNKHGLSTDRPLLVVEPPPEKPSPLTNIPNLV